ncbi:hypothetical protein [Thermodesulfitimonas autotrophica]|uniref:hypothetical protein n=1 Tax=Thermodesulfitimonas autotrophica TaxID=1894989 RepID=UPI002FE39D55
MFLDGWREKVAKTQPFTKGQALFDWPKGRGKIVQGKKKEKKRKDREKAQFSWQCGTPPGK